MVVSALQSHPTALLPSRCVRAFERAHVRVRAQRCINLCLCANANVCMRVCVYVCVRACVRMCCMRDCELHASFHAHVSVRARACMLVRACVSACVRAFHALVHAAFCTSARPSVRPSVRLSVRPSVHANICACVRACVLACVRLCLCVHALASVFCGCRCHSVGRCVGSWHCIVRPRTLGALRSRPAASFAPMVVLVLQSNSTAPLPIHCVRVGVRLCVRAFLHAQTRARVRLCVRASVHALASASSQSRCCPLQCHVGYLHWAAQPQLL